MLTLVLKRFSMLVDSKVERDVPYPEHLDLWSYLYQGRGLGPLLYRLYTVLDHAGRTCHRGHCFCYLRAMGGPCLRKDDAQVNARYASVALSQCTYVLFYVQTTELERDGREARCPWREHKVAALTPRGVSEEPAHEAPVKHRSLEQWRLLQEQSRPKP